MSVREPREVELKLAVDAGAVARLAARLQDLWGEPDARTLTSVYYDTPDYALRRDGVSLRVRTGGGAPVQTVKRATRLQAGLFDRDEWESEIASAAPDLEAFRRTPPGGGLDVADGDLAPVFETAIERSTWTVEIAAGGLEIALDQGEVVTIHRRERFAELELELKSGTPQALFDVLQTVGSEGALWPGVQTKSERGYRLLGTPPKCLKAEALHLDRRMDVATAFAAIVHGCLRHFWLNEPLVTGMRSPDALHQARVALRRLRSALSLFKDVVEDAPYDGLRRRLQVVSRELGDARNLDVYLGRTARPDVAAQPDEPGGAAFLATMEARRTEAYDRVIAELQSKPFRDTMLDLLAWTEAGPWRVSDDPLRVAARDRPVRRYAADVLERRRRVVTKKGRDLASLDPQARHRVRIAAKKLRYAAEFFAGLVRGGKARHRHAHFIEALQDVQEHLGDLNDIETGHAIAVTFAQGRDGAGGEGLFAAAHASGRQDAQVEPLLAAAARAHRTLKDARRFWSAWAR